MGTIINLIKSLLKFLIQFILALIGLFALLAYLPSSTFFHNLPIEPIGFEPTDTRPFFKLHPWNNLLSDRSELLLKNKVVGPESIVTDHDYIYTGLADGRVVEIDKKTLELRLITWLNSEDGTDCSEMAYWRIPRCGRALGMRLDSSGHLIVVDSFTGVYKINVTTGHKESIALGDDDDVPANLRGLYNDYVQDPKLPHILYVTVSTRKWGLHQLPWPLVEHEDTGAVLAVNLKTKKTIQILDHLHFTNGIDLSADGLHLLISETCAFRILKLKLDDVRKLVESGKSGSLKPGIFTDVLPGEPDNVRLYDGDIWVGFAVARSKGFTLGDKLGPYPLARKVIARFCYLSSIVVDAVHLYLWPQPNFEELAYKLRSGHIIYDGQPPTAAILRLDGKTGKTKAFYGSNKFAFVSEAHFDSASGDIYFASFRNKFIGKVNVKNLK